MPRNATKCQEKPRNPKKCPSYGEASFHTRDDMPCLNWRRASIYMLPKWPARARTRFKGKFSLATHSQANLPSSSESASFSISFGFPTSSESSSSPNWESTPPHDGIGVSAPRYRKHVEKRPSGMSSSISNNSCCPTKVPTLQSLFWLCRWMFWRK